MGAEYKAITRPRWFYSGDINPENGGFWYRLDDWKYGYAEFVRVTPCSDAGGPDNQFWIERGTINGLDDSARVAEALKTCGQTDNYAEATAAQRRHIAAQCVLYYGRCDIEPLRTVQIGKAPDPFTSGRSGFDPIKPDTILRAGSDLARFVRREFLRG